MGQRLVWFRALINAQSSPKCKYGKPYFFNFAACEVTPGELSRGTAISKQLLFGIGMAGKTAKGHQISRRTQVHGFRRDNGKTDALII